MGRYNVSILIALLMWAVSMSADGAETIEMPIPKEGDRWEFKAVTKESSSSTTDRLNGNYEVVYLKGQLEVSQIVDGQKSTVGLDSAEELKRMIAFGQRGELQYLNFPLAIGKKWRSEYRFTPPGSRSAQQRSADFRIEENVEIQTAAGRFPTLRIKGSGQRRTIAREWEYFYSPNTKSIVKFYYDSNVGQTGGKIEIELLKFVPAASGAVKP